MPDFMASHWNMRGEVNGYMSKFWGLFLMPLLALAMWLLFLLIPKIDPLKHNIQKFREYFDNFIALIILFLFYIYVLTLVWNLGYRFDLTQMMLPAFAILFYYSGVLISKTKQNWFIGIRTPWTLSSENVWKKTHKLGSKLFKACALISLLGLFFVNFAFWLVIIPVILSSVYVFIFSYLEHKKEQNGKWKYNF